MLFFILAHANFTKYIITITKELFPDPCRFFLTLKHLHEYFSVTVTSL